MLKSLGLWKSSYEDMASSLLDNAHNYQEFLPNDDNKSLTSKENKGFVQEEAVTENKGELQMALPQTKTTFEDKEGLEFFFLNMSRFNFGHFWPWHWI